MDKKKSDSFFGNLFRRIHGLSLGRPINFSWIDSHVAGSGQPKTERALRWLKRQGITAVLSLTEIPIDSDWVKRAGLDYKHVPVRNHEVPDTRKINKAVKFLQDSVKNGKKVGVHCAAGQGRTGTILASYLVANGRQPAEAIEKIRRLRPDSIEKLQEKAVYDFYETIVSKQKR